MLRSRALFARQTATLLAPKVVEFDADAIASKASKPLQRSTFQYKGSEKGGEVGARNEAAFIGYEPHAPANLMEKYAMPDPLNLLTIMPVLLAVSFVIADVWGVFLWDVYCRRHYKSVVIERPAATA
uniref:Uncharacterized protein n=1 Tax=Neobodo designis TaxID=312471 RepID=A0A7S1PSQ5_NEODS|mmetsp:Transcript_16822/g.52233  ORF Transcript_16822/g.52233 Transcript_16822/m.52233 type:complete len:127 (+) Transcript_16822:29-409(+)